MKKFISLCLLLCCLVLVSCKNKEYEELKSKFETLQKEKETIEIEKNDLQKEYEELKLKFDILQNDKDSMELEKQKLQKDFDNSKRQYKNLKEQSKLSNKSESEIKQIKEQEMQEKLKSFGLKIINIKTYWLWERVNDGLFVTYFKFYPCIRIELANIKEKRLDSVIVKAFFNSNFGDAHAIIDNLHPNYNKVVLIKSPVFKKSNTGETKEIPIIEADVKFSINDGKEFSIGLIKIDKTFEQK
ncbi:MAG: hypothetical protein IKN42_05190 [Elusimicrobia bacterium]|nr:hypothetical protein [Elusimicrobiota bacterium]